MNRIYLIRACVAAAVLASAGCGGAGGSATDALGDVISAATAPYAVVDLGNRSVSYLLKLPNGGVDASVRTTGIAFRRVTVGSREAFVGVFELTQAQWQAIAGAGPTPWSAVPDQICDPAQAVGPDHPAYNLDYENVVLALAAFPLAGGARLAVTSDAQWTAACGTSTGWWWGDTSTQAQVAANAVVRESVLSVSRNAGGIDIGGPLAVGSRQPNGLGFFDLHGNVWELIAPGDHVRGGSWRDAAYQSRSEITAASGQGVHDQLEHALIGVRLVLIP